MELFLCEQEKCKLFPLACLRRQYIAEHPVKKNPLDSNPSTPEYSKCLNCTQGKEILKSNPTLNKQIYEEYKIRRPHFKLSKKGPPKRTLFLCDDCREKDPTKFYENRKNKCKDCISKYQRIYRENHKKEKINE